ncbi:hypothetical protein C483_08984 [Natrialba hulunbeirensis JCM 10989]|uniref:Uncharacterized protein n=1 Tax=Natrialba hulunbeirensis JCM 10989 TaxID=1227493 RepID=L9ZZY5_9EURY|nr:hypothetical protein [Natrialba hulunbeirensis]ELY91914.1 hypothetical protein C483_08984 [Natrialba hulunbeirensis JCM 10989]
MIPSTRIRQTLIAACSPIASLLAAGWAYHLLLGTPSPATQRWIETTIPSLVGAEPHLIAALAPTVLVVGCVVTAVLAEQTARLTAAQTRRRELETHFFEESE